MSIEYRKDATITVEQFADLLHRSTLAERRPVDDPECLAGMIANNNLLITAWAGDQLIGAARSLTDFHYACYVSDLAVDQAYQGRGIGRQLLGLTQQALGPRCTLILLAAPKADGYYEHIGMTRHPRAWTLRRDQFLQG